VAGAVGAVSSFAIAALAVDDRPTASLAVAASVPHLA
jgi:hypothetical protein